MGCSRGNCGSAGRSYDRECHETIWVSWRLITNPSIVLHWNVSFGLLHSLSLRSLVLARSACLPEPRLSGAYKSPRRKSRQGPCGCSVCPFTEQSYFCDLSQRTAFHTDLWPRRTAFGLRCVFPTSPDVRNFSQVALATQERCSKPGILSAFDVHESTEHAVAV